MYIVIEMQTNNGTVTMLTYQYNTLNEAKSKYHLILASAAISEIEIHTAMIINPYGGVVCAEHYTHIVEEPEQVEE